MIADNLDVIRQRIAAAAKKSNRSPGDVKIVCVTKNRTAEEIKEAIAAGVVDIGENRVQEARLKYNDLTLNTYNLKPIRWHLIGHLQTNKVKDAVSIFYLIHSVDSLKLAQEIDKQAAKINKIQDVLIEVNVSGEETKFGVSPQGVPGLVGSIAELKNLRLLGFMTMAPIVEQQEDARPYFKKLRELQTEINVSLATSDQRLATILSMGMSQDYEAAVEEGATMVRVGSAIFNTNSD